MRRQIVWHAAGAELLLSCSVRSEAQAGGELRCRQWSGQTSVIRKNAAIRSNRTVAMEPRQAFPRPPADLSLSC